MARGQQHGGQEGSRWINRKPEPEELATWFSHNVKVHDGLSHATYLPGITLIPNKEKVREPRVDDDGSVAIVDVEQLVFTPYPKVETRVSYFWDLMLEHPEWEGKIEKVEPAEQHKNLPPGFFHMPVTTPDNKITPFVGVTHRVRITHRDRGHEVILPPDGTKVVPLLKRGYNGIITADENAILKAETGSIGRALGFAGMLVVPGAGVATYEDMMEFLAGDQAPQLPEPTVLAEPQNGVAAGGELKQLVADHIARLESEFPQQYELARAWANEKGYSLDEPPETALRGLERMLRNKLAEAEKAAK